MNINIDEISPGHITLTCKESGSPLTRSNSLGMFCDAEICVCEQRSLEMSERLGIGRDGASVVAMFENMFGSEGFR